jgi:hypothetical protein
MADQKRWFKVWTSILLDPTMNSLELCDVGRWVRLGALTAAVGDNGRLTFPAPAETLLTTLKVSTLDDAKCALQRLPHVQFEEGKSDNTTFTVIISNWFKYQRDSTGYDRVKRSRAKRREEKRRKEEIRTPLTNTPPVEPPKPIPESIKTALASTRLLNATPKLWDPSFWQSNIRATNGRIEYAQEILKAEAWLAANPTRAPRKDLARFFNNWLSRIGERA